MRHFSASRLALCLGLLAAPLAQADDIAMPRTVLPRYNQECAACHMAYPPGLLPGVSWQRIMSGLDKHYGTDAALDAASVQQIGTWLQTNAGTYKRVREEPPNDRITQSNWFARKHRKLAPEVWKRASIKSAANCMACHAGADKGAFDDDNVHIPK